MCKPGTIGRSQLLSRQQISFQLSNLVRAAAHLPLWGAAAQGPRLVSYSMLQHCPAQPGCRLPRGLSSCTFPGCWHPSSIHSKFWISGTSGPVHMCWTSMSSRPHCSTVAAATEESGRQTQLRAQTAQHQRQLTTSTGPGLKLNEQQQRAARASKDLPLVVVAGLALILQE